MLWHAGEPLVLGPGYYDNAFRILEAGKPTSVTLVHKIQSNGTLLSQEWCAFLKEHQVVIGLSVDGPQRFHDRHRRTRSGSGTFAKVDRAIDLLTEYEIPFYAICVLTRESLDHPDAFFDFFDGRGIPEVLFNIEEIEGANRQSSLDVGGIEENYRSFLSRYFDLRAERGSQQRVREWHGSVATLLGHRMTAMKNHLTDPFSCIAVDCDGRMSTFSPELLGLRDRRHGDFVFGSVLTDGIDDMARSAKFAVVAAEIASGVDACRNGCSYFPVCGGGSPSNKLSEHGSFAATETLYCRLTVKSLTDLVLEKLAG